jgi:hypothetical protein
MGGTFPKLLEQGIGVNGQFDIPRIKVIHHPKLVFGVLKGCTGYPEFDRWRRGIAHGVQVSTEKMGSRCGIHICAVGFIKSGRF